MNFKQIKMHNGIIKDAVKVINECYRGVKRYYYGDRISKENLNKNFGLINSIKGIFSPKDYVIKGYNKLVSEYKIMNTRKDFNFIEIEGLKNDTKKLDKLQKQEAKFRELFEKIDNDKNFDECARLLMQREIDKQNLNATKTEYKTETKIERESDYEISYVLAGTILVPIYNPVYKDVTKTYKKEVKVPDEKKRKAARENIEKLEKQLAKFPNLERNIKLYRLQKDTNLLASAVKRQIRKNDDIERNVRSIEREIERYKNGMHWLGNYIKFEKDLILRNYPKIDKSLLEEYDENLLNVKEVDKVSTDDKNAKKDKVWTDKRNVLRGKLFNSRVDRYSLRSRMALGRAKDDGEELVIFTKDWDKLYKEYKSYFTEKELEK